jgi:hypothetical protein
VNSSGYRQCLADIRKQIKEESESWRREKKSIWRIPTEIWETIFQFTLQGELKDYLDSNTKNPLRSTPIFLSHVCRHWRLIAQQASRLLALVYDPPAPSWYLHEYDRLTESIHRRLLISPSSRTSLIYSLGATTL